MHWYLVRLRQVMINRVAFRKRGRLTRYLGKLGYIGLFSKFILHGWMLILERVCVCIYVGVCICISVSGVCACVCVLVASRVFVCVCLLDWRQQIASQRVGSRTAALRHDRSTHVAAALRCLPSWGAARQPFLCVLFPLISRDSLKRFERKLGTSVISNSLYRGPTTEYKAKKRQLFALYYSSGVEWPDEIKKRKICILFKKDM